MGRRKARCKIKNKELAEYLKNTHLNKLRTIGRNLGIVSYSNKSKNELISDITKIILDTTDRIQILTDVYPKNELSIFLMHLPDEEKNFINKICLEPYDNCDNGTYPLTELYKEFGRNNVVKWSRELSKYGLIFELKDGNKKYVAVPLDITYGLSDLISLIRPPEDISLYNFLKNMTKSDIQHICRLYGLKVSGNKEELINNIIRYGLKSKDVLSTLYYEELVELANKLNIYPWGDVNLKELNREQLIRDLSQHIYCEKEYRRKQQSPKSDLDMVYEIISNRFSPIMKWNSTEADIEKQLISYLRGFFDGKGLKAEFISQYKLPSGGKIDVYEKIRDIGIELKYNPSRSNLRETVQRIKEYREHISKIIVAIFYEELHYAREDFMSAYKSTIDAISKIPGVLVLVKKVR